MDRRVDAREDDSIVARSCGELTWSMSTSMVSSACFRTDEIVSPPQETIFRVRRAWIVSCSLSNSGSGSSAERSSNEGMIGSIIDLRADLTACCREERGDCWDFCGRRFCSKRSECSKVMRGVGSGGPIKKRIRSSHRAEVPSPSKAAQSSCLRMDSSRYSSIVTSSSHSCLGAQ